MFGLVNICSILHESVTLPGRLRKVVKYFNTTIKSQISNARIDDYMLSTKSFEKSPL